MTRILIAGVGYRNLRDHSCGVVLADRLAERDWPEHVAVEDLSYNPIAVVQRLQDEPLERRFDLAILVGALPRGGRAPGTCRIYRWDNVLPGPADIHDAITEAVTGIIALDNTLIVGRHFGAWPADVIVIEIEPEAHEFGDQLTPAVAAALDRATGVIATLVEAPATARGFAAEALLPGRPHHTGVVWTTMDGDVILH